MADKPLISFILISYRQEAYICEAVAGALAQTYSPLEIIFSDDCSPDRTFEIIKEMTAAYRGPHQIILNRNPQNLGLMGNFNRAMELSRGELLVESAGDDISAPERTTRLYQAWEQSGRRATSVFSNARIIDETGQVVVERYFQSLPCEADMEVNLVSYDNKVQAAIYTLANLPGCMANWVLGAVHAFHRRSYEIFGPIPGHLIQEDVALAWRSLLLGGFAYVDEPLVAYRRHSGNLYPDHPSAAQQQALQLRNQRQIHWVNQNRLSNVRLAVRRGLINRVQFNYFEEALRWEIQCGKVTVNRMEGRWLAAFGNGLASLITGVRRKKMCGWLLWLFVPGIFARLRRMPAAGVQS